VEARETELIAAISFRDRRLECARRYANPAHTPTDTPERTSLKEAAFQRASDFRQVYA